MRGKRLLDLAVAVAALLFIVGVRSAEAASAGPAITVYQNPT